MSPYRYDNTSDMFGLFLILYLAALFLQFMCAGDCGMLRQWWEP
jgi:hypothetical protein